MTHNDPSTPRHHLSFKLRCNANKQPIYFPRAKTIIPDPITSRATAIFTGSGISSGILDLLVLRLDAPQASSRSSTTTPSVGAEKDTKVVDANSWRVGALPASPSSSLARKGGRRAHSLFLSSPRSRLPIVSLHPLCSQDLVRFSLSLFLPRRRMGSLASEILPVVYSWLVLRNVGMFSGLWKPTPPRENTRCNGPRVARVAMGSTQSRARAKKFLALYLSRSKNELLYIAHKNLIQPPFDL